MKTFDIALEYLKGFNFSKPPYEQELLDRIEGVKIRYLRDPDNNVSNEYYKTIVLEVAFYHCMELFYNKPSAFAKACKIVDANKDILKPGLFKRKPEKYAGTMYPKKMMDEYITWCRAYGDSSVPEYFSEGSEVRDYVFHVAYHYTIDKIS